MNLFGLNIRISRRDPAEQTSRTGGRAPMRKCMSITPEEWLRGEDVDARGAVMSNAYEQVVWVYRAINVLAEQVANIPFVFSAGERGRENLITSGPLLEFYARPHPHLNRFQYWELRVIWLMLRGECFRVPIYGRAEVGRGRDARLKQVLILDPARFQHIVEDNELIGWRYTGFGPATPLASQVFLPEEVWFEKLPNPFDFWRGFPPLYVAGAAAQTDFAASAFMRGIIENNGDTGVIVRTEKWLGDEQREQILASLRERKRRAGVADRPVLLNGSAEVLKPELSSSDLQFLENRKFSRAEICAAFGVPEEIVTTTDHSKYDVMAGARLNFIENRVAPLCTRLEAAEDATVKSIDPRASGWFDLESLPILQEARRSRLAAARTGFEMGVPFNELNRVLDLGFKPLPWGDRGFVSAKLQQLGNAPGTAAIAAGSTSQATIPVPEVSVLPGDVAGGAAAAAESNPLSRAEELLSSLEFSSDLAVSPRLQSKLRRFLFEQRGRALAALEDAPIAGAGGDRAALLNLEGENQKLLAHVSPLLETEAAATAGAGPGFVQQMNQALIAALEAQVAAGLAAGQSREQLSARVKAFYNDEAANLIPQLARHSSPGPSSSPPP